LHPSQVNKTEGEKTSLEQDDQKQLFVSHFIKSPKSIADLIENDLISGGHESMAKYARAIAAVNAELVHLIEPYLEESTRLNLQQRIREFQGTGDQATYEIRQVLSRLKNLQEPDGKSIFSFLNRINDQQLMFMLRDEQPETIAITLAQLKVERAQNILSHFDLNKKTEILTRMGMISMHPSRVFKEVALRLTEKLPELEGMKDLTIDGLSGVLNILDNLSEDEQREMLSRITEKAPKLAGELNKEFFGFGNITTIDDKIVEKAIREIETEQLLNALAGYRGDVVEKIINLRPGREQMVLRSQIAINGIPPEAGTEIRRKIINSIRNQLKKA
jgi:flagellar motor switch protein FliG